MCTFIIAQLLFTLFYLNRDRARRFGQNFDQIITYSVHFFFLVHVFYLLLTNFNFIVPCWPIEMSFVSRSGGRGFELLITVVHQYIFLLEKIICTLPRKAETSKYSYAAINFLPLYRHFHGSEQSSSMLGITAVSQFIFIIF